MHQKTDNPIPKYYKLMNGEDIVAYELSESETHILIKQPMSVMIENDLSGARQLLNVREWLPPIVTKGDEVQLPKTHVIFTLEVNDSFKDEFKDVVAYFYGVVPKKRKVRSEDKERKVVSIANFVKDDGKVH